MGTNYYRVNIPSKEDITKIHEMVDEQLFNAISNATDTVESFIYDKTKSIHICKISGGWKVAFDHNWGKYYEPNRASLEKFLSEPNTIIKDEYGEVFSPEEFWRLVEDHNNSKRSDGNEPFDSKSYIEHERALGHYYDYIYTEDRNKCKGIFGIQTQFGDFTIDGLRFSVSSNFC